MSSLGQSDSGTSETRHPLFIGTVGATNATDLLLAFKALPDLPGDVVVQTFGILKEQSGWEHESIVLDVAWRDEEGKVKDEAHLMVERRIDPQVMDVLSRMEKAGAQRDGRAVDGATTLEFDDDAVAGLLPVPGDDAKATMNPRSLSQSVKTSSRASCEFLLRGRKGSASDEIRFLKQSIMGDSKVIAKLTFRPDSPFLLEDVLTIAKVISDSSSRYCLVTTMCFWFVSMMWGIVLAEKKGGFLLEEFPSSGGKAGKLMGIFGSFKPKEKQSVPVLTAEYRKRWGEYERTMLAKREERKVRSSYLCMGCV